jgi:hypothetical protein
MFHDESRNIARRSSSQVPSIQATTGPGIHEQALIRAAAAAPVKLTDFVLYQPLDDVGVSFFMSTYVGDDPAVSQLYYLPKLFAQSGSSNPALRQSITAAGLAGYAKTARRTEAKDAATKLYVSAIRSINNAISDPKLVLQDATLMSIVMAAMFEVLVVPRLSDMRNANKHLNGAVAVALHMLKQKKMTDITYKLITTSMQSIIINSWISHVPLPANFMELKRQLGGRPTPQSIHSDFLNIVMELVEFREALQAQTLKDPTDIIERALAVDAIFDDFAETMPPQGHYESFRILQQDVEQLAYNGYYHGKPHCPISTTSANNFNSLYSALHRSSLEQCSFFAFTLTSSHSQELSNSPVVIGHAKPCPMEVSKGRLRVEDHRVCNRGDRIGAATCGLSGAA